MLPGRHRIPQAIKDRLGTARPDRARDEIIVAGTPEVPAFMPLNERARAVFDELVRVQAVEGVHGAPDGLLLAMLARGLVELEDVRALLAEQGPVALHKRHGRLEPSPLFALVGDLERRVLRLMGELGLTAVARLRLAPPKSAQPSLWDDDDFEDIEASPVQ